MNHYTFAVKCKKGIQQKLSAYGIDPNRVEVQTGKGFAMVAVNLEHEKFQWLAPHMQYNHETGELSVNIEYLFGRSHRRGLFIKVKTPWPVGFTLDINSFSGELMVRGKK